MRRNSGADEGRNRHLDPTVKEHERTRGTSGAAVLDRDAKDGEIEDNERQRTTEMGSHARKTGEKGEGSHR
jgi:hypothetical protein